MTDRDAVPDRDAGTANRHAGAAHTDTGSADRYTGTANGHTNAAAAYTDVGSPIGVRRGIFALAKTEGTKLNAYQKL